MTTAAAAPFPLSSLRVGEAAWVVSVVDDLGPTVCRRLADLGFLAETPVQCLRKAPFGSPVVYCVGETELCMRGDLADCVMVERMR